MALRRFLDRLRRPSVRLEAPETPPTAPAPAAWSGHHHPVFEAFQAFQGDPHGAVVCALGSLTRPHFIGVEPPPPGPVTAQWPEPSEEYFEWIDILEAVRAAGDRFTMLELGAGYGRWTSRAALAARSRGIVDLRLGLAEAEPEHAQWLRQHMADNGVTPDQYRLYPVAVAADDGEAVFCVDAPDVPEAWYGQSIVGGGLGDFPVVGEHFGRPVTEFPGGARVIVVPQMALATLLADYDLIDLIDFDLQGAEADAIASALLPLGAKVRRMHIGTHGADIEARLREMLPAAGWTCLRDYPCGTASDTDFGRYDFNDGVQTWVNPRL